MNHRTWIAVAVSLAIHCLGLFGMLAPWNSQDPPAKLQRSVRIETPSIEVSATQQVRGTLENEPRSPKAEKPSVNAPSKLQNQMQAEIQTATSEREYQEYLLAVRQKIQSYLRVPETTVPGELKVTLRLTLMPDGRLALTEFEQSSPSAVLNQAALRAVTQAAPFGAFPHSLSDKASLVVKLPFIFRIH